MYLKRMRRVAFAATLLLGVHGAAAMPTPAELNKAQPLAVKEAKAKAVQKERHISRATGEILHSLWAPLMSTDAVDEDTLDEYIVAIEKDKEGYGRFVSDDVKGISLAAGLLIGKGVFLTGKAVRLVGRYILLPMVLISLAAGFYYGVGRKILHFLSKVLRLNIDPKSEFFHFFAIAIFAYLAASHISYYGYVKGWDWWFIRNEGWGVFAMWGIIFAVLIVLYFDIKWHTGKDISQTATENETPCATQPASANDDPDRFALCRIWGVPVFVHWSVAILVAVPFLSGQQFLPALQFAAMLVFSVIAHEAGHAIAGKLARNDARKIHVALWGGWTEFGQNELAKDAVVSLAGPAANLAIAIVAWMFGWTLLRNVNLALGLFNLLPAQPLDGGKVLLRFLRDNMADGKKALAIAGWTGIATGIGVIWLAVRWYMNVHFLVFWLVMNIVVGLYIIMDSLVAGFPPEENEEAAK